MELGIVDIGSGNIGSIGYIFKIINAGMMLVSFLCHFYDLSHKADKWWGV